MIVVSRFAETASFNLSPEDSEVRFLTLLAQDLAARGKKAVFFIGPLNRQLIADYELIDPTQYAANVAILRAPIEARGIPRCSTTTPAPTCCRSNTSPTSATPTTKAARPWGRCCSATPGSTWG